MGRPDLRKRWFGRSEQDRRSVGMILASVAALLLAATVGGIGFGLGAAQAKQKPNPETTGAKKFDEAVTYYIRAEPSSGVHETQPLEIGDVTLQANCGAYPATIPGYPYGIGIAGGIGVTNNGLNPVAVAFDAPDGVPNYLANVWLEPGAGDPVFWAGEMVNESQSRIAFVSSFAILDHGDTSVTGVLAFSARVNGGDPNVAGDEFGECILSVQAKG